MNIKPKELIEIIKGDREARAAFGKQGVVIEYLCGRETETGEYLWFQKRGPYDLYETSVYRIKQPGMRELNAEELAALVGTMIVDNETGDKSLVLSYQTGVGTVRIIDGYINATTLRNNIIRTDGTRFEVLDV